MEEENQLFKTISGIVDAWVGELVKRLVSRDSMAPKRGLWDRFKGGVSNLLYGRDNKSNPYYWRNRFGDDLGVEESFFPGVFTLSEYGKIKFFIDEAERKASEAFVLAEESSESAIEKLKIVRMLRAAGEDLKNKLSAALAGKEIPKAPPPEAPKASPPNAPRGKRDIDTPDKTTTTTTTPAPTTNTKASNSSGTTTTTTPAPSGAGTTAAPTTTTTAAPVDGGKGKDNKHRKGSFAESLHDTLKMIREGKKSSIVPDKSWLKETGFLSYSATPKVVAWLSMKNHVDISDDSKVMEILKRALPESKGFQSRDGNTLLKILKDFKVEKETMMELGASEEAIEKLTPKEAAPAPQPAEDSKTSDPLAKIYEGKDSSEEVVKSVEDQLIKPMSDYMGKNADILGPKSRAAKSKKQLDAWWESIKKKDFDKDQWVEFVKTQMIDSILKLGLDEVYDADDVLKYLN